MNNILLKNYTNTEYANFAVYANETQRRIEDFNGDKYALLPTEILQNGQIVDISQTHEYIAEQIQKRKDAFYKEFIKTSKGCLRLKTKVGDLIALLPSITLGVQITGKLNANEIVLYPEPDFTIERTQEQLEQWLLANQYYNEEMTLQEYMLIVIEITQAIKSLFNS